MSGVVRARDEHGEPQEHCFEIGGSVMSPDRPVPGQQAPAPAPTATNRKATAQASSDEPKPLRKMLAEARARLRVVEREIKARQQLEQERDQIKRLISAALTERDNVRRIRAAG